MARAALAVARRLAFAAAARTWTAVGQTVRYGRAKVAAARAKVRAVRRAAGVTREVRRALATGAEVEAAVAGVASLDHTVAAVLSGLGAAVTAAAVQVGLWWRRVVRDWAAA